MQDLAYTSSNKHKETTFARSKNVTDVEQLSPACATSLSSNGNFRWLATTSLNDGAAKLLVWHLDWALPYFLTINSTSEEGDVGYSLSPLLSSEAAAADQQPTIISIPLDREAILVCHGISWCSPTGDDLMRLRKSHRMQYHRARIQS